MTDYFTMMRDTVGSFGEGREDARQRQRQIDADARVKLIQGREDDDYARKLGMQKKTDVAYGSLEALNGGVYDGAKTDFGAPRDTSGDFDPLDPNAGQGTTQPVAPMQGMRGPSPQPAPVPVTAPGGMRKATDREFNQANMGVAISERNLAQQTALRAEGKKLDIGDTAKANIEKMAADPEYLKTMVKHLNLNHGRVTIDDGVDKDTGKRVRPQTIKVVTDDGGVHSVTPSSSQMKTVAYALAHMEHGDGETGLSMLAGVDKTLAEMASKEFTQQHANFDSNTKSAKEYEDSQYHTGSLVEEVRSNKAKEDELAAYHKRDLALRSASSPQPLSKEAQADLAGLYDKMEASTTEADRVKLVGLYNARLGREQLAGRGGHISFLPSGKGDSGQKVNPNGSISANGKTYIEDPKKPGHFVEVQGIGKSAAEIGIEKIIAASKANGGTSSADRQSEPTGGLSKPTRLPGDISPAEISTARSNISALDARIAQAQSLASAAAKSQDTVSISRYGTALNELVAQKQAVISGLGPFAAQLLK